MKSIQVVSLFVLVNALLSVGTSIAQAAQAKHTPNHRSGQAAGNAHSRGAAQGNQQWSADPDRGWVRGDEAREVNEQRSMGGRQQQNRSQANGKGKKF